ncbi:hypothetical protein TTHERM_00445990 (macronuclear) [Tetrahymena thermophila SB210]|uniref:Uncharacterized protein n=1 Tax=Tetrahymena thermophila (strain SB210) TaxID=312017 RepID=I7MHM8_TETTS|nr:hypothetical protein TTHERM_00445990 [Tetrahymena thermophila SB210]EAS03118.3 hypothetical protein TTHERM_00445990 [Tetrahymena thermophila SB210]|eukprot:XP_001023363.3 hypothetical protein TTHERM_00445990 [Tetrahymena thermophila SB210]
MDKMIEEQIQDNISNDQNMKNLCFKDYICYKEVMVGTIKNMRQLEISNKQQTQNVGQENKKGSLVQTPHREFIQTFSFQNSIYIAYVNGNLIRILRQRFVKIISQQQSDYQEFFYTLNENICNQIFFMGVENANHDSQLNNSVIIIIPCANGQIYVKQLIERDALKRELNIESHGQIIYSIGQVYSNNLKQRIELCACLANQKVFCYEIDVGSLNENDLNFIRHTSEIKLFDNFLNQFYYQKLKQNQDQLFTHIIPVSRFILLAVSKDFKLKVINFKQKQVKIEYSLLNDKETISLLDPFKNVKVSALINNPLQLSTLNNLQNVVNVLISVSFINNSIVNYIQLFNLEVFPQQELGQLPIAPDQFLSGLIGNDERILESGNPLGQCTNVKFGELTEIYSYQNKSEIIDVNLSPKGIYIASIPSNLSSSIQLLKYEDIMNISNSLSISTVFSADFNIRNLLQQDLLYLENDDSNMAFKEYPLNRLFRSDRFPLKLIHEFYSRYQEFRFQDNYIGNGDIKRVSEQLLNQNELKFETAVKNSLMSLTNNWFTKYPVLAIHTDIRNSDMLPVIIRENGLFNLVPMCFYESLNFKLNEFVSEYNSSLKNQSTFRDYSSKTVPQNKYSQDFSNTSIYLKYQNWCEQLTQEDSSNYLSQIFELLSWTKLFLIPDIQNCLNQCPYGMSFIQCIQQGIQSASNTLSYESLSDQFESILCDEQQKNKVIQQMKILLEDILVELFHENIDGNIPININQQPLKINIDFCVWSKNLISGSIRYKIRELVELLLIILSFFKYIEYRKVTEEDLSYLENIQQIVAVAYSITYLFDKPLLQIDKINKLAIKSEDQTLDHVLFMDVLSYFISGELSQSYQIAEYDHLNKNSIWMQQNIDKVELSLFQNLSLKLTNNYLPNILKFLKENHQYDISLCISQFLNQTPAVLYSQAMCLYQTSQYTNVLNLLHKIICQIHINPSILNDGPWTVEKNILAIHQELKDLNIKEDIKFIRYCLLYFFKETFTDLRCKQELAQMGLLLFDKYEEEDIYSNCIKNSQKILCKLEFLRACFQYSLQTSNHQQAFNYIKQINEVCKRSGIYKQILDECIQKFVQNLCNNENIGLISQLIHEDDLAEQIEKVINEENKRLLQKIIENYQLESDKYLDLDKQLSKENLYKFNSSMNFYISIKNYKQAGLSQWFLYNTLLIITNMDDQDDPMPRILYENIINLQILALAQAQFLFEMAGYEQDIVIYENYRYLEKKQQSGLLNAQDEDMNDYDEPRYAFNFSSIFKKSSQNQYMFISVSMIQKLIIELESKLLIEQCNQSDQALRVKDQESIIQYLIQYKCYGQLITFLHTFNKDFTDILIYFTEMFYEQDNGRLPYEEDDIDYFQLIRKILILNQNDNYMKYSVIVLKSYGSCIKDNSIVGEKMKSLAYKFNLPKMSNFLFQALSDFGEDRVLAEEIAQQAKIEYQNVNYLQVNRQVNQKQYIPLQLISKVLDNKNAQKEHQLTLMQIASLFQVE